MNHIMYFFQLFLLTLPLINGVYAYSVLELDSFQFFFVENFFDYLKVFSLEESFDRNCSIVSEVDFIVLG